MRSSKKINIMRKYRKSKGRKSKYIDFVAGKTKEGLYWRNYYKKMFSKKYSSKPTKEQAFRLNSLILQNMAKRWNEIKKR